MANRFLCVYPAYGRDYKTDADAVSAWNDGKDFAQMDLPGTYLSKRDAVELEQLGFLGVRIYYNRDNPTFVTVVI
jgi:hypothetical protein